MKNSRWIRAVAVSLAILLVAGLGPLVVPNQPVMAGDGTCCCGETCFEDPGNPYTCSDGCVWHASYKRPDIPDRSWGLAKDWDDTAKREGFAVDTNPQRGDIVVIEGGRHGADSAGHVAYVESVGETSFFVSEMNWDCDGDGDKECYCERPVDRSRISQGGISFIHKKRLKLAADISVPAEVSPGAASFRIEFRVRNDGLEAIKPENWIIWLGSYASEGGPNPTRDGENVLGCEHCYDTIPAGGEISIAVTLSPYALTTDGAWEIAGIEYQTTYSPPPPWPWGDGEWYDLDWAGYSSPCFNVCWHCGTGTLEQLLSKTVSVLSFGKGRSSICPDYCSGEPTPTPPPLLTPTPVPNPTSRPHPGDVPDNPGPGWAYKEPDEWGSGAWTYHDDATLHWEVPEAYCGRGIYQYRGYFGSNPHGLGGDQDNLLESEIIGSNEVNVGPIERSGTYYLRLSTESGCCCEGGEGEWDPDRQCYRCRNTNWDTVFIYMLDNEEPPNPDHARDRRGAQSGVPTDHDDTTFEWDIPDDPGGSGVKEFHLCFERDPECSSDQTVSVPQLTVGPLSEYGTYYLRINTEDNAGNRTGIWSTGDGVWETIFTYVYAPSTPTPPKIASPTPTGTPVETPTPTMTPTATSTSTPTPQYTEWEDLPLENPGFERGDLSGWIIRSGGWEVTTFSPHSGRYSARKPNGPHPGFIYQDVDLSSWQDLIDRGLGEAWISIFSTTQHHPSGGDYMILRFRQGGTDRRVYERGCTRHDDWSQDWDQRPIPPGTDNIRAEFGTCNDSTRIDDAQLKIRFRKEDEETPTPSPTATVTPTVVFNYRFYLPLIVVDL